MNHYVVIGNSAAGCEAAAAIRAQRVDDKITIVSNEADFSYQRPQLVSYILGKTTERGLVWHDRTFFQEHSIELLSQRTAIELRPKKNTVLLREKDDSGGYKRTTLNYDYLILTTGAGAHLPQVRGIQKRGVVGFRSFADAQTISGLMPITTTACVVGGGFVGLQVAAALRARNIEVKLIIKGGYVLSQLVDEPFSRMFEEKIKESDIELIKDVVSFELIGNGDVKAIKLHTGKVIGCSIVVVAQGVRPNIDLVKETEIEAADGIVVNSFMQTTVPHIYAAGDVCQLGLPDLEAKNALNAWQRACAQGRIAGVNAAGGQQEYTSPRGVRTTRLFDIPLYMIGAVSSRAGYTMHVRQDERGQTSFVKEGGTIVGAVLAGAYTEPQIAHAQQLIGTHETANASAVPREVSSASQPIEQLPQTNDLSVEARLQEHASFAHDQAPVISDESQPRESV